MRKRAFSGIEEGACAALAMANRYRRPNFECVKRRRSARWVELGAAAIAALLNMAAFAALFEALGEADGSTGEIEGGAEAIFEEALIAEVQGLGLVGEEDEGGRGGGGLGDVEDFDFAAGGRGAALEVYGRKPAVELTGGDATAAGFGDALDEREKFFG